MRVKVVNEDSIWYGEIIYSHPNGYCEVLLDGDKNWNSFTLEELEEVSYVNESITDLFC